LQAKQSEPASVQVNDPDAIVGAAQLNRERATRGLPELHVLVRTPEQLEAALALTPASITLDYLDLYGLRPSVERIRATDIEVRVASPRILKPGEEKMVNFLLGLDTAILVRSGGLLEMLAERPHRALIGDFSLNAANSVSAEVLLQSGLSRITPTHDLNGAQITDLAERVGGESLEVIAYQHLPVFHTEHCVFCRFLSSGTSFKDCGRPCEKHVVSLRDTNGRAHPLMADIGCRNTVFGAEAQEASSYLDDWQAIGIRHLRLEFAHENARQVEHITEAFSQTLKGWKTTMQLAQELRRFSPQGTTEGSLFVKARADLLPVLG
jgi:putative protease